MTTKLGEGRVCRRHDRSFPIRVEETDLEGELTDNLLLAIVACLGMFLDIALFADTFVPNREEGLPCQTGVTVLLSTDETVSVVAVRTISHPRVIVSQVLLN